jgi:glycosyltransferase involved in cell wall biosynthesis
VKVLLFTNLFPTPSDPNRGLFTAQLAREMASRCELRVCVPLPWTPTGRFAAQFLPERYREFALVPDHMQVEGLEVDYPRYPLLPKVSERWQARLMRFGLGRYLARLRRRFAFDVINAQWLYPDGTAAVALAKTIGVPVVLTGLGCDVNEFLFRAEKRGQILGALEHASAITVVSRELANVLETQGIPAERITTIPNGVDTARFHPASREAARLQLGIDPARPLIVCISRLSQEKGVQVLVEAAALLTKRIPGVLITVVGEGPQRDALEGRIRQLQIVESMTLVGSVRHRDVAAWLAAANVACMPSLREGHPNAALEAMACGRPLVASRVGSLASMINDKLGRLVPPNDPSSLAKALEEVLAQDWNDAAIAQSVEGSSWSAAAERYLSVLTMQGNHSRKAA